MAEKKQKKKPCYDGKEFDSYEEIQFWMWCKEAYNAGFISGVTFHPETFILAEPARVYVREQKNNKTEIKEKFLLHGVKYTADFLININPSIQKFDHRLFSMDQSTVWIDVKPVYSKFNDLAKFSIIRKWLWETHGVFVNKVNIESFFQKTWVPLKVARQKNGKRREKYLHCRNVLQARALTTYYPMPKVVPPPEQPKDLFETQPENGWNIR